MEQTNKQMFIHSLYFILSSQLHAT